ncbi:MAG: hypothetical protein J6386_02695 [Candidatus Synoicihabitans palmerolidicus]|nr:hypothetical protein [Candidatus Synoicihabitans palmerolidicus]
MSYATAAHASRSAQFKPDHDLNPDTLARYAKNRLRVVPEVVYRPWTTEAELAETGVKAKAWRIDLVLFVNGIPWRRWSSNRSSNRPLIARLHSIGRHVYQ